MEKEIYEQAINNKVDVQKEVVDILESNLTPRVIKKKLLNYHDSDIADVLGKLSEEARMKLIFSLDTEQVSDILEYLDDLRPYLSSINIKKKMEILSYMEDDIVTDYLQSISKIERDIIIDLMSDEDGKNIRMLLDFDEDEIGSIMSTNYIRVTPDMSIKEAMRALTAQAAENDNISTIYVLNKEGDFYGAIDLKDLIIARENTKLDEIIKTAYPYVYAKERIEDCLENLRDYSEDSIPVLNQNNHLIGVITSQTMVELVGDEMQEDYAKLAGLIAEEDIKESVKVSVAKRIPWLFVLLALGLIVSSVVGVFEKVVSQLTIIIMFQSLILDMAGNVGTQSLAVTIRVLMDEDVRYKDKLRLIGKEVKIGLFNGFVLGFISFVCVGLFIYFFKKEDLFFSFAVSGCIGISLLLSMVIASLAGTLVPMTFKKAGIDPAVASGPLITTLNDLVAVITYYGLSWVFLIGVFNFGG